VEDEYWQGNDASRPYAKGTSKLTWEKAKSAARDAWHLRQTASDRSSTLASRRAWQPMQASAKGSARKRATLILAPQSAQMP
jgi:hypothetical protein